MENLEKKKLKKEIIEPGILKQAGDFFLEESFVDSLTEKFTPNIENDYDESFIDCVNYISKDENIRLAEGYELLNSDNELNNGREMENNLKGVSRVFSYATPSDGKIYLTNYIEKKDYKMMLGEKINKSKLNSFENLAHLSLDNLIPIAREVKNYFIKRDLESGITDGLNTQERFSNIYKQVLTDLIDISIDYVMEDKGAYRLINQKFLNPKDIMDNEGIKLYVSAFSKFINLENERRSKLN